MWRNKKPDAPQGVDPEPKNLQTNQPLKPAPASREGITNTGRDAAGATEAMADPATARLGAGLHVKGGNWGNEGLYIEGNGESLGLSIIGKRKSGATTKL